MNGCSSPRTHGGRGEPALPLTPGKDPIVSVPRARMSARILFVAFWLGAALSLAAIGYAIALWFGSSLLGFLGADFVFLIAVSVYTSGQSASPEARH